jgi:hypothetical protein
MKVTLGKVYGDGSQDVTFDCMSKPMKETLLRLGMIKAMEDAVKANAEWLVGLATEQEAEFEQHDCTCSVCNGSGEGMYDGTRCRSCKGSGVERREED